MVRAAARSLTMQAAPADPSPSIRPQRRSSRRRDDIDVSKVDLVGPPDPISNIRPMFYAPIASSSSPTNLKRNSSSAKSTNNLPHPYSLSEFSQSSTSTSRSGLTKGLGKLKSFRDLVDRVTHRVEESELRLRIGKMGTDNITQRFWRDNNLRFNRDLDSWREESQRRISALPEGVTSSSDSATRVVVNHADDSAKEMSKDESIFYANWLRANAKRNRSYNVLVWKQAWEQVRLGARVSILRQWLRLLQRLQGR